MKAKVTKDCMGDRHCNNLCPEVFEYDEDELKSVVKFDEIPGRIQSPGGQSSGRMRGTCHRSRRGLSHRPEKWPV